MKKEKGITLIALIITIIVLLILAGVTISMILGQNGMFGKANEAKINTEIAEAKESAQMDIQEWKAEELVNGRSGELTDDIIKEILTGKSYVEGIPGDKSFISAKGKHEINYSDLYTKPRQIQDGVTIPTGFYYVGGTKETGLVISDVEGDDLSNSKQGNQFVWVPVEDISKFIPIRGYNANGELDAESSIDVSSDTLEEENKADYNKMKESVELNKGFYIGRYEAGKDETGKVICKKGANVYNNVLPYKKYEGTEESVVTIAQNFARQNGHTGVTSTLIYGVQWDATMQFFDSNYITNNCSEDSYVRNSKGRGNYGISIITTGSVEEYKEKNIYDMAGNVEEYTMEESLQTYPYKIIHRNTRGGAFSEYQEPSDEEYIRPSSYRSTYNYIFEKMVTVGFRVTLYL